MDGGLVLRADAGADLGMGHAMRCLALAQAWRDARGRPTLATASDAPAAEARWRAESLAVRRVPGPAGSDGDADATAAIAREADARWVVVDGRAFGAGYFGRLRAAGLRTLAIDDLGDGAGKAPPPADVVLNQNLHARASDYAGLRDGATLLLGPAHALLRREFRAGRGAARRFDGAASRVLLTAGGGDPLDATSRMLEAVARVATRPLDVVAAVGGHNPRAERLSAAAAAIGPSVRVRTDVDDMAALMEWADVAVSSSGSTVWELCATGLPAVLGAASPSETALLAYLRIHGPFDVVGPLADADPSDLARRIDALAADAGRRAAMSARARAIVDGKGCERVLAAMHDL